MDVRYESKSSIGMLLLFPFLFAASLLSAQQDADRAFVPDVAAPAWAENRGPVMLIDEAHHNFHTMEGRYKPFADLMRADGFQVDANRSPFTRESLRRAEILVISNALNERNVDDWSLPTPSAFTEEEIEALRVWIEEGGALMLIVDHMPMPGCAEDLAQALGLTFRNGYAENPDAQGTLLFTTEAGSLRQHPIIEGRSESERVNSVATFNGSAFRAHGTVEIAPLFVFEEGWVSREPTKAGESDDSTPRIPIEGWYQGATVEIGKGRIAVFGEAAMFTSQTFGDASVGMSHPMAGQNQTFLLNVVHWLARLF